MFFYMYLTGESFNESFSESDNKQPTSTTLNTVAYFPYDRQNFTEVEPFQQNNLCNIDSTVDYMLWSQSFAPTVDPGMNMH
ncbi:14223_t:CDS:2 [Dentiscutata erythropus]|uniref:14223_t:CDS:1 n=1 Tax=Dentiscutata erythropus TaxID=1348616 RepID=A0A9N9GTB5_9GLOM|nr:14223_t:CDS:2 [Dentiscutata erythropus]